MLTTASRVSQTDRKLKQEGKIRDFNECFAPSLCNPIHPIPSDFPPQERTRLSLCTITKHHNKKKTPQAPCTAVVDQMKKRQKRLQDPASSIAVFLLGSPWVPGSRAETAGEETSPAPGPDGSLMAAGTRGGESALEIAVTLIGEWNRECRCGRFVDRLGGEELDIIIAVVVIWFVTGR
jgi:hypothetical protein